MKPAEVAEVQAEMEIVHEGADDVMALDSLACCFPAGTLSFKSAA